ncbi:uncharacterized protein LOC117292419 [Asterias rubens]|uniref:uncharacterized protein LOC117292419 n=1 Tax=Asterias rubens TaxID=7604 RepID=UPI001455907D|nr:uncharacterized protein LOC117292419 [Asterias rubens]
MPKRKIHKDFKLLTVKKLIQGKGKSYRTVEVPLADAFHPRQNRKASTKSPQENGNLLERLDGDFRRVRKVNSGTSQSDPKYNNYMLIPKEEFDDFAHDYDDCVSSDAPDSSDFETGDAQRAQNKACQLDTTGVFGAECMAGFLNMKHGERQQGASRRTPNTTKRKTSAYHCFMQQYLSSEGGCDKKKRFKQAAEEWKKLSEENKAQYMEMASKMGTKPPQVLGSTATFQGYVKKMAGCVETMCSQVDEQSLDWLLVCSHPRLGLQGTFGSKLGKGVGEELNVGERMIAAAINKDKHASVRQASREELRISVMELFNEKYKAVTGKKQLSYKAVQEGRVICDGLPPQIPLKKPTAYSKKALQNILMNKDCISFRVSPQPSSDNASTSTCQAAGGVNTEIHPEPATSGILLSEVNTLEQEVEIPEDLATLQSMMEPNKDTDSDLYIVERITDKKNEGGKLYYLVKWQDYKIQTWEPASNIPPAMRAAYQNK